MKYLFSVLLLLIVSVWTASTASTAPRTLKLVNNNVYLYEGSKKVDTLTTKWNRKNPEDSCNVIAWWECISYTIIRSSGKYGIVQRDLSIQNSDGSSSHTLIVNLNAKKTKLVDITSYIVKKYWVQPVFGGLVYNLNSQGWKIILSLYLSEELEPGSVAHAKKYGFNLGKNTGTQELPEYKNATIAIPETFFTGLLK